MSSSACYEPHVIPSCLIFHQKRERRETNVHGSTGVRSGSRLEPFLLVPIPASHARLLGTYMGLLASRGVKHSECLGIASSDDQRRSLY